MGPGDKAFHPVLDLLELEWALGTRLFTHYVLDLFSPPPSPLQVVDLLISALHCMSKLTQKVANSCSSSSDKDARGPLFSSVTSETTLRLTNHCWEQLSEVYSYIYM